MTTTLQQQITAIQELAKTSSANALEINDALNTLHAIRLIGLEKVMYAPEMYDLIGKCTGSGFLSVMQMPEKFHTQCNELMDKIYKFKNEHPQ